MATCQMETKILRKVAIDMDLDDPDSNATKSTAQIIKAQKRQSSYKEECFDQFRAQRDVHGYDPSWILNPTTIVRECSEPF